MSEVGDLNPWRGAKWTYIYTERNYLASRWIWKFLIELAAKAFMALARYQIVVVVVFVPVVVVPSSSPSLSSSTSLSSKSRGVTRKVNDQLLHLNFTGNQINGCSNNPRPRPRPRPRGSKFFFRVKDSEVWLQNVGWLLYQWKTRKNKNYIL